MTVQPINSEEAMETQTVANVKREDVKLEFMLSHTQQRQLIGGLGIFFPFALMGVGKLIFDAGLQISLSDYYHTGVRDIFVGMLFLIGVFLITYRGYDDVCYDGFWSTIAGICAIGTALFPTVTGNHATRQELVIGTIHVIFAFGFLGILGCIVLVYFRRSAVAPCKEKLRRNRIYTVCGWLIIGSILLALGVFLLPTDMELAVTKYRPVLILETIAIVAFGVAWLIKGEWLFTKYLGLVDNKYS